MCIGWEKKSENTFQYIRFHIVWGLERIWTAVEGFADLCLAARPRDLLIGLQIYENNAKGIRNIIFLLLKPLKTAVEHRKYCVEFAVFQYFCI